MLTTPEGLISQYEVITEQILFTVLTFENQGIQGVHTFNPSRE